MALAASWCEVAVADATAAQRGMEQEEAAAASRDGAYGSRAMARPEAATAIHAWQHAHAHVRPTWRHWAPEHGDHGQPAQDSDAHEF